MVEKLEPNSQKTGEVEPEIEYTTSEDWPKKAWNGYLKDCSARGLFHRRTPNLHKPCEI